MDKTEFSEFAHALGTFYQDSDSPEKFARKLFENIYIPAINGTDTFMSTDMDLRTFKAYYYGNNDISQLAKKISGNLDLGNFAQFLKNISEDSLSSLCDTFQQWCPNITPDTFGMEIAEYFQKIIEKAAKAKRKRTPSTTKAKKVQSAEEKYKERYGLGLVAEELSVCPNDLCTNPLYIRINGKIEPSYEVVVIDPAENADDENNLIAMCPECAKKYQLGADVQKIQRMKQIKKRYVEIAEMEDTTSHQKVTEEVRQVLLKVPTLKYPANVDLNYEPAMLKQKISPDYPDLLAAIKIWVNLYYPDVHQILQELNREGKNRFEPFCLSVRQNFLALDEKGHSQWDIYNEMISWLQKQTNQDRHACEIVIAYFVQKCEVFLPC